MSTTENTIDKALALDPLDAAEKLIGKSYKSFTDEEGMQMLGLAASLNLHKQQVLEEAGDSFFSMKFAKFCELVRGNGFTEVWSKQFQSSCFETQTDTEKIFITDDGFVMFVTSFGDRLNSGTIYGSRQIKKSDLPTFFPLVISSQCSGGVRNARGLDDVPSDGDTVFDLSFDVREGLLHRLNKVRQASKPMSNWGYVPFLWFVNYSEEKHMEEWDSYRELTARKIRQIPELKEIIPLD